MPSQTNFDGPITNIEKLLAAIAGENVTPDKPQTRIERLLAAILQKVGDMAPLIVVEGNDELDKTWQEIFDAVDNGRVACVSHGDDVSVVIRVNKLADDEYIVTTVQTNFKSDTADGYPTRDQK